MVLLEWVQSNIYLFIDKNPRSYCHCWWFKTNHGFLEWIESSVEVESNSTGRSHQTFESWEFWIIWYLFFFIEETLFLIPTENDNKVAHNLAILIFSCWIIIIFFREFFPPIYFISRPRRNWCLVEIALSILTSFRFSMCVLWLAKLKRRGIGTNNFVRLQRKIQTHGFQLD